VDWGIFPTAVDCHVLHQINKSDDRYRSAHHGATGHNGYWTNKQIDFAGMMQWQRSRR
jgi:hypothetical protein